MTEDAITRRKRERDGGGEARSSSISRHAGTGASRRPRQASPGLAAHADLAGVSPVGAGLSEADGRRLDRWRAHLARRGAGVPDQADFLAFGGLSTLERLRRVLAVAAPGSCGPLALAIAVLGRAKRAKAGPQGTDRPRGPALTLAVAREALRPDWRRTIETLRRDREAIDRGMVHLGDEPPAASILRGMEYTLRSLSAACLAAGVEPDITRRTVALWLDREEARLDAEGAPRRRETGLSLQLRLLALFLRCRRERKRLRRRIARQAARLARIGALRRKRKHAWLLQNPTDIGRVWGLAEDLLAQSRQARPGTARRRTLVLHAVALALPVVAPLRIGDLHRLHIGREITRDATGWAIEIVTQKTSGEYDRPELWAELTPFLDALLEVDAPGSDLWTGYDARAGTPLFSRDGGARGLSADWISDVWYEHVGIGQHIVRTLWHEAVADEPDDRTWIALALCGQRSRRTANEYRETKVRARKVAQGRALLQRNRQAARLKAAEEELQGSEKARRPG